LVLSAVQFAGKPAQLYATLDVLLTRFSALEELIIEHVSFAADEPGVPFPTHACLKRLAIGHLGASAVLPLHLMNLPGLRKIALHSVALASPIGNFTMPSVTECRISVSTQFYSLAAIQTLFPSARQIGLYFGHRIMRAFSNQFFENIAFFFRTLAAATTPNALKTLEVTAATTWGLELISTFIDDIRPLPRGLYFREVSKRQYFAGWIFKE
jgi:hypothetical protein